MDFKGLRDCLVKIYKSDGIKGLYRGFNVSVQDIITYPPACPLQLPTSVSVTLNRNAPGPKNTLIFTSWVMHSPPWQWLG